MLDTISKRQALFTGFRARSLSLIFRILGLESLFFRLSLGTTEIVGVNPRKKSGIENH